jgi:hypothetical protein
LFRPCIHDLTAHIVDELRRSVPELAGNGSQQFGRSLDERVHRKIAQFIERLDDGPALPPDNMPIPRIHNSGALRRVPNLVAQKHETTPEARQKAYLVGGRVAWRLLSRIGEDAGISTDALCLLAEAIFSYIDEQAVRPVDENVTAENRARARRRQELLDVLINATLPKPTVTKLAEAAGWPVPDRVVAVALERRANWTGPDAPALDRRVLVDLEAEQPCLLVPASERALLRELDNYLPGWRAAVGPAVPPSRAAESLHWARRTAALVDQGALPDATVTWFDDHMSALWLFNEPLLANQIRARTLAPMAELTRKQRDRITETLSACLECRGNIAEMSELLGIHPQTVRYRLRQVDRLFGEHLTDPDGRFDLEVALRAERGLRQDDSLEH